jgi:hypothetical protein
VTPREELTDITELLLFACHVTERYANNRSKPTFDPAAMGNPCQVPHRPRTALRARPQT